MVIVCGQSFPDAIDPERLDEVEARSIISRLGQIRKRLSNEDKSWALKQILAFMKSSPYLSCKVSATATMGHYFQEMEDMQEICTDVVYDLCEDAETQVRILGYNTLPQLVARNNSWTARNTDVLVQLLQSEDEDELLTIRKSIEQCVRHDPAGALPVLCDYAVVLPETDQSYNPELRQSVFSYMLNYVDGFILEALEASSTAIESFADAIVKVIRSANSTETTSFIDRVVFPAVGKYPQSVLAERAVGTLMEKATSSLTQKDKAASAILLDATTYFEQAAALASISSKKALSERVLEFGAAKLLASSAFAATPLKERLVITRSTLALYAPIAQTAQASLRVLLARRFDKLADTLLAADDDNEVNDWSQLKTLLVDIAAPSWESSRAYTEFETQLRAIKQRAETRRQLAGTSEILTVLKKFEPRPALRRPPPSQTSARAIDNPTLSPSPASSAASLKRKADPPSQPLPAKPSSGHGQQQQPQSLLSRLQGSVADSSSGDRSPKRVKTEPTLLDRLQGGSKPSSPALSAAASPSSDPAPMRSSAKQSANDRPSPGGRVPTSNSRATRISQTSAPYAVPSDLRIKNASSSAAAQQSQSNLIEPLRRASLEEQRPSVEKGQQRGGAQPIAASSSMSSTATDLGDAEAPALRTLSIRGAANKPKATAPDVPAPAAVTKPTPSQQQKPPSQAQQKQPEQQQKPARPAQTHRPSLLERAGLVPDKQARQQQQTTKVIPIQSRLSAPSLEQRMQIAAANQGDESGGGAPRRRGRGGGGGNAKK